MRIVRAPDRVRIVEQDIILSEVLLRPGPTNMLLDVLSAAIGALSPGPRVAVLGFGAGGVVGPLRAMGCDHSIEGVDLSPVGEPIFRECCGSWAGDATTVLGEACEWLDRKRKPFDFILEDLSESHPESGAVKPWVSLDILPAKMAENLVSGGSVAINLLPWPGASWRMIIDRAAAPFDSASVVLCDDYENRILIAGDGLPGARAIGHALRSSLRSISSKLSSEISIRHCK